METVIGGVETEPARSNAPRDVTLQDVCRLCGRVILPDFPRADYRGTAAHRLCALEQKLDDLERRVAGLAYRESL